MSIYGRNGSMTSQTSEFSFNENLIEPTLESIQLICMESSADMCKLIGATYVADILVEEAVTEGADVSVLLEGFASDTWSKIKQVFQKLWDKIRAWFDKVITWFKVQFVSGKKFIAKYKEQLRKKSVKGFKYNGYHYKYDDGVKMVNDKRDTVSDYLMSELKLDPRAGIYNNENMKAEVENEGARHNKSEFDFEKTREDLMKRLGADETSELLDDIREKFRGGSTTTEEFEEFAGNKKDEMISFVDTGEKKISNIETARTKMETHYKKIMQYIDNASGKIDKDEKNADRSKHVAYATHRYKSAEEAMKLLSSLSGVEVEMTKEIMKKFEGVLKSFLVFRPTKEGSYSSIDDEGGNEVVTESLLDAAWRHV